MKTTQHKVNPKTLTVVIVSHPKFITVEIQYGAKTKYENEHVLFFKVTDEERDEVIAGLKALFPVHEFRKEK